MSDQQARQFFVARGQEWEYLGVSVKSDAMPLCPRNVHKSRNSSGEIRWFHDREIERWNTKSDSTSDSLSK